MKAEALAGRYFKSLPAEVKIKGEEIYKKRKNGFAIDEIHPGLWRVLVPRSILSTTKIEVAIEQFTDKIEIRCSCQRFKKFNACEHTSAAACFIEKEKLSKGVELLKKRLIPVSQENTSFSLAFLFHHGVGLLGIKLQPILIVRKDSKESIKRFSGLPQLKESLMRKLATDLRECLEYLEGDWRKYVREVYEINSDEILYLGERGEENYREFYFSKLKSMWTFLAGHHHLFSLNPGLSFKPENLKQVTLGPSNPEFQFRVFKEKEEIIIQLQFSIEGKVFDADSNSIKSHYFITADDKYYLLKSYDEVKLFRLYGNGRKKLPYKSWYNIYQDNILPLQKKYKVEIDPELNFDVREMEPEPFVLVAEYLNQYLMMIPHFVYEDNQIAYDDKTEMMKGGEDETYYILRNRIFEKQFFEKLRPLHPAFAGQLQQPFFYVRFQDVMKGNWFLKTIRKLQQENVLVKGFANLKKFRYNVNIPKFKVTASSGIDWFDVNIKLEFDKIKVPLQDIQNAVLSGQKMIVLSDGSFGMLPEEWLKQFEWALKTGKADGDTLRLNKKHFNLILDLDLGIKEDKMIKELEEKKRLLVDREEMKYTPLSKQIKAELRPYQHTGFQWMQSLDHLGWGGCLADDMGLGKTLQTIAFLQFVKETHKGACSLVVSPTSLIYNWEAELKKFGPELKYFIYYGSNRHFSEKLLMDYDIILTSYGSVRNDVDELKKYSFRYIILDESQAIKNPESLTAKACLLLNSHNRLILSGTPVQNNTFDLYTQMHFLNPGLLGNKHFFKDYYATPIDKNQDKEAIRKLKKMTEPFILRRTKEKVAPDLPDKSEIILWCHLKESQQEVYDKYKLYYRQHLMEKIEEEGIGKSSFYILEGLTRLRQICDSPVLVNDPKVHTTKSVKLDELMREISENTGSHQVLIFSQFTEMLRLIRERFEVAGIDYLYLDGKTPGKERMQLVNKFQNDKSIKAFLISLKAGGVGLNLTAADYVYLVDPWWNPAVEAQAIDRTHRIGQVNKVFAYKMICKDTVEERILQLQRKKKNLSEDLIGEESSFVSKLTKEDIAFLFK